MASNHGQFNTSLADPSFCPFGEELHPLQLHLEGLSDTSYLNLSRHFFLRDIGELRAGSAGWGCPRGTGGSREGLSPCSDPPLSTVRPGPPQELTLQQRGEQLHLAWAPPASWPLPKSYFTLLYHLQYELHNGTQVTAGSLPRGTLHRLPRVPTLPCAHPAPSLTSLCLGRCSATDPSSLRCFPSWDDELSPLLPPVLPRSGGAGAPLLEGLPRPSPAPFAGRAVRGGCGGDAGAGGCAAGAHQLPGPLHAPSLEPLERLDGPQCTPITAASRVPTPQTGTSFPQNPHPFTARKRIFFPLLKRWDRLCYHKPWSVSVWEGRCWAPTAPQGTPGWHKTQPWGPSARLG